MEFWEAMMAYRDGKKIRCRSWPAGHYMWGLGDNTSISDRQDFWFSKDEEWELYEQCQQTISFAEVVKGLKEGKNFRRLSWPESGFVYGKNGMFMGIIPLEDFEATDWVEVK